MILAIIDRDLFVIRRKHSLSSNIKLSGRLASVSKNNHIGILFFIIVIIGAFGEVLEIEHKMTKTRRAAKMINKDDL
jgi:hypothetical protein